ncbi:MAG: RIP metalloprotease RseP [Planctomycetota bacterium]
MLEILNNVLIVAGIIFGVGLVILVHELGHFIMAKKNGVRVDAFSIGLGWVVFSFRRGETEYRISAIPVGGYVKMAGEGLGDETTGAPDELTSKTVWQRFQIFIAGGVMNILLAFPLCAASFLIGKYVFSPEVGSVSAPEEKAGMEPGDVLLEVDGTQIEFGEKYRFVIAGKGRGTLVPVKVRKPDGTEKLLKVEQSGASAHLVLPRTTQIVGVREGSPAWKAGFRPYDVVVSIDGREVFTGNDLQNLLQTEFGRALTVVVRRIDPETQETFEKTFTIAVPPTHAFPMDEHLIEATVGQVVSDRPADGKLEKGDRILRIDGEEIRSYRHMKDIVEPSAGKDLAFRVLRTREEKTEEVTVRITPEDVGGGRGIIGIRNLDTDRLAHVAEGSFYYAAGLRSGDVLLEVGSPGDDFTPMDMFWKRTKALAVRVKRGGENLSFTLQAVENARGDIRQIGFKYEDGMEMGPDALLVGHDRFYRRWALGPAMADSVREPYELVYLTYQVLYKLIAAEESVKGLAGPVGIAQISYQTAALSWGNFLWLLALITVNLGIFNLLPIPVLDGGHVVLLLIEKVRGRPPSDRFKMGFQYIGIFFLLALIMFITYSDIERWIGS